MSFNASSFEALQTEIADLTEANAALRGDGDTIWVLIAGFLVFFMHAGFSMLEAGSVRHKNAVNILFKNIGTVAIGGISYFFTGYALAYGASGGSFASYSNFAYTSDEDVLDDDGLPTGVPDVTWFFQFAFAATAATIVSGAVAGRISLGAYFIIAAVLTGVIYPIVTSWVWKTGGWISAFTAAYSFGDEPAVAQVLEADAFASYLEAGDVVFGIDPAKLGFEATGCGMIDYAGSGVVHLTGGMSALIVAKILGPRLGRFDADGAPVDLPAHNVALQALGTFILWFGWYGFNCGSTLFFDGANASHVAVTTTLSPSAAVVTVMFVTKVLRGYWDINSTLNAALAGLVSITAPCSTVEPYAAVIIGALGGLIYLASSKLMLKLKIDDPVDAISVHGACGVWGVLAVAIFATDELISQAYSVPFEGACDRATMFSTQIVGLLAIISWVTLTVTPVAIILKVTGMLRVSAEHEEAGLDASEHGSSAFVSEKTAAKLSPA